MRIGELSQSTGVDIETIRYYEKAGLLPLPEREANGYRYYDQGDLERLAFIRHCRALDMSLADVKRLLDLVADPTAACDDVDHLVDGHLARVRARLKSLRTLERQLSALRSQCNSPHVTASCGILHDLVAAAHGDSAKS